MNKLKVLFFIGVFVFISLKYGDSARGVFLRVANSTLSVYLSAKNSFENTLSEHFAQKSEIQTLRAENAKLKVSAELLNAFAGKLNELLKVNNVKEYNPKVQLVSSVSYAKLNDFYKVWIDYEDFNASKIYGLLYNGNSAGIVVQKDGNPLALLLGDPKSIFSVFVGDQKIPGVVAGKNKEVQVKYIPLWMNPKVGDRVVTSGLDGIFFSGVGVGVVKKIINEELSKTAVIEPYVKVSVPLFYHIIKEN
jgi:rod shape-determining protein MreC